MFFFKRKKTESKTKGLPDNLSALKHHRDVVWVWDPDYKMMIWANNAGMEFWNVTGRNELKELIFPMSHPLITVTDEAIKATAKNKPFVQNLILKTYPQRLGFKCNFEKQILPDGRTGLLVRIEHEHIPESIQTKLHSVSDMSDEVDMLSELHNLDDLEIIDSYDDESDDDIDMPIQNSVQKSVKDSAESVAKNDIKNNQKQTVSDEQDDYSDDAYDDNMDYLERFVTDSQNDIEYNDDMYSDDIADIITPMPVYTPKYDINTPMTFTVDKNGKIIGFDDASEENLHLNYGVDFKNIFVKSEDKNNILAYAVSQDEISVVTLLDIHGETLPFLLQTRRIQHHADTAFNCGLLHITQAQYDAHIKTQNIPSVNPLDMSSVMNIIDGSTVGIIVMDNQGKVISANPYILTLLGLYIEDILGRSVMGLFDNATADLIMIGLKNADINKVHLSDGVHCLYHGDNNETKNGFLVVRHHPQKSGHYWVILSDRSEITDLKKQVELLKSTTPEQIVHKKPVISENNVVSEQADICVVAKNNHTDVFVQNSDELPEMVTMVSHELRAPLNAVSGYAELLKSQPFGVIDPRYMDYIQSLEIATLHAKSVVNDLLDYSKIQSGEIVSNPVSVDLNILFNHALTMVRPDARKRQIDLIVNVLADTPKIMVDEKLLLQILINLLSNAVKYSDDNENVYIAAGLTKTNRLMIEITNFGAGFTKEQLEIAMKPYGRVGKNDKIIGTGLGLPIVKKLTELTQGHFMIESIVGERTRTRIIYDSDKIVA